MAMSLSRATKPGAFVRRRGLELRLRSTALMWSAMALTILALAHAGALGVPLFLLAVYLGVRGHRQHGLSKRWLAGARSVRSPARGAWSCTTSTPAAATSTISSPTRT
jgi:hypothetical protein